MFGMKEIRNIGSPEALSGVGTGTLPGEEVSAVGTGTLSVAVPFVGTGTSSWAAVKVSVIMGTYNPASEGGLRQALDSIRRQTLQEWEMILCDDGSDASHAGMIRRMVKTDERIVLLRNEENRGLGYSLNRCLSRAKGKYIARMDDDDISMEKRLEKEYDFLERHPQYEWVGTNAELFDGGGTWGTDFMPERPRAEDFLRYSPYIHPSVMFRRQFLVECGGYQTAELTRRCEDYELFMRLHGRGARGYNIQESLLAYREDKTSYQRRTARTRGSEAVVRLDGFHKLGILRPDTLAYVLRPLVAGAVPSIILQYARGVMRGKYRDRIMGTLHGEKH